MASLKARIQQVGADAADEQADDDDKERVYIRSYLGASCQDDLDCLHDFV
jgi:hypothetical protein